MDSIMDRITATFSCDASAFRPVLDAFAKLPPEHSLVAEIEAHIDRGDELYLMEDHPASDGVICVHITPSQALIELAERAKRAAL